MTHSGDYNQYCRGDHSTALTRAHRTPYISQSVKIAANTEEKPLTRVGALDGAGQVVRHKNDAVLHQGGIGTSR